MNITNIIGTVLDIGRNLTVQKTGDDPVFVIPLRHSAGKGYVPVLPLPGKIFDKWTISTTDELNIFKLQITEQEESWGEAFNNATFFAYLGKIYKIEWEKSERPIGANVRLWGFSIKPTGNDYNP